MANKFREIIARNLKQPSGIGGILIKEFLRIRNTHLEQTAIEFCKIEPHNRVMELGFGPGAGLKAAYKLVKDGSGKVFGVDISDQIVKQAKKYLKAEIQTGKLEIHCADVINLPFQNDSFDKVFHCNCYYFWPDMKKATEELYRVMAENSQMLHVTSVERTNQLKSLGLLKYGNIDPERYMDNLKLAGFENVIIDDEKFSTKGVKFRTISAEISKKTK